MGSAGQTKTYFELHVEGKAREVYVVMAKDQDHAIDLFNRGAVTKPLMSEVENAVVVRVVERNLDDQ